MANPTSSMRGVLRKKTTNAFIQQRVCDNNECETPKMKFWTFKMLQKDAVALEKAAAAAAPKVGQKRSIAQVDGTVELDLELLKQEEVPPALKELKNEEDSLPENGENATKTKTKVEDVGQKEEDYSTEPETEQYSVLKKEDDTTEPPPADSKVTTDMPVNSFHASQEGPLPIEEQFQIQDEASQETLEKLVTGNYSAARGSREQLTYGQNMTPLPQSTLRADTDPAPKLATECSQDSTRMSSFIDFDGESCVKDDGKTTVAKPTAPLKDAARKAMIDEKAEMLRTRLQLAAHKVCTNQINTPFRWLHCGQGSPEPRCLTPIKIEEEEGEDLSVRIEAAIEAARQKKQVAQGLNSLPLPTVLPAAYSTNHTTVSKEEYAPSSPPSTRGEKKTTSRMMRPETPPSQECAQPRTPMPLSTLPGGKIGEWKIGPALQGEQGSRDLTSSALKSEAANGLLELIRAAAESQYQS